MKLIYLNMNKFSDKSQENLTDLHLRLSEKFAQYEDLTARCLLNPSSIGKGDKRVFYIKPKSPFLQDPRKQNQFRQDFLREVTKPPNPEPLTLLADDMHKSYLEKVMDKSNPDTVRQELNNYFQRRQYKLQHKRYKLLLRWAHFCLTSDIVDRTALNFSPAFSKIQFELENCVKRCQRLDGDDHFLDPKKPRMNKEEMEDKPSQSAVRADDIDVYLRLITYEDKITRLAEKFINKAKWVPMTKRYQIYSDSIQYFQNLRQKSIQAQKDKIVKIKERSNLIISKKKMGDKGRGERDLIIQSQNITKLEKKLRNARDQIMFTAKYYYEGPPKAMWNEPELKVTLLEIAQKFELTGDIEIDKGHSFSYSVTTFFPQQFHEQMVQNMFAPYDALPEYFGNAEESFLKNKLEEAQFINSAEHSLFGAFNVGQMQDFPTVKVKKSDWVEFICFQAELDKSQMYQAALLSSEQNPIDECLSCMMETIDVQDLDSMKLILETLCEIHSSKVISGDIKEDMLKSSTNYFHNIFTDDQIEFFSIFNGCFHPKQDDKELKDLSDEGLLQTPNHLLHATYLLNCLSARKSKTKLLYTLNAFRSIQRRISLELQEMGTRDRVMGDVNFTKPAEPRGMIQKSHNVSKTSHGSINLLEEGSISIDDVTPQGVRIEDAGDHGGTENLDIINNSLVDINKYRFNNRIINHLQSTCPIVPKFHATFGQPVERQEISAEIDMFRNTDIKEKEGKKLLGRADKIYTHEKSGLNLVEDDFKIHILYDATFLDMRAIEQELYKICSYFINLAEPLLDKDITNIYPLIDRLKILEEVLELEANFQDQKLSLVQAYLECFEHSSDILEQQRLIQVIVDEMAKRPRINLSSTYFKDSYLTEIACLKAKTDLIRQIMRQLIKQEFDENNLVREYLENTYRLLHEQMEGKWQYNQPEKHENEMNKRQLIQTGDAGTRDSKNDMKRGEDGKLKTKSPEEITEMKEEVQKDAPTIFSSKMGDPKEFANYLGMPFSSLQMLMKDHHERDPLVRQAIHEHVSFIKVQEGYPQFIYGQIKTQNKLKFTQQSENIGIFDFYESLHSMPKVISSMMNAFTELMEVHRPDNGLLESSLELSTVNYLKEQLFPGSIERPKGIEYIEDNAILGNSDKMLFYSKELLSSAEDTSTAHNPFVIAKLDLDCIEKFNFDSCQGYIDINTTSEDHDDKEADEAARKLKVSKKNFGRFFPKLKERVADLQFPSMLVISCNILEILRLRNILLMTLEQLPELEKLYTQQQKILGKNTLIYFKESLHLASHGPGTNDDKINFIEEGPASDIPIKLAINEFDQKLRTAINFSEPESFKCLILPLGLEELRVVVQYELVNLHSLIIATKMNQILLDNSQRKLCEIDFFEKGFTVANPCFNLFEKLQGPNILEGPLHRLPATERSSIKSYIQRQISDHFYDLMVKKMPLQININETFKNLRNYILKEAQKDKKEEVKQRYVRTAKMIICQDFCQNWHKRVVFESVKLQLLHEIDIIRKRQYLLPRENMIFKMNKPLSGEHSFAGYNEEHKDTKFEDPFFNKQGNKITDFVMLPSNSEIVSLPVVFKIKESYSSFERIIEEYNFFDKDQLKLSKANIGIITPLDCTRNLELSLKQKLRLVDFKESYDFGDSLSLKYLTYFSHLFNIFSLEFFMSKVGSSSVAIANVENKVLSGIPFWEDADDEIFNDMSEEEEEEGFDQEGHKPAKNKLAEKVVAKQAKEKKLKMQLRQDLETVQDRFNVYLKIMKAQEMQTNIQRATKFLKEIHHICFYGMLSTLYCLQDKIFSDKKGKKEVQFLNQVIKNISHQDDLKFTNFNGFHVNNAITNPHKVNIESNCYNQEYDSFFKASQQIIDEQALNPPEFNILASVYLNDSINLTTFKKTIPYTGYLFQSDYRNLDYALTNLNAQIRKYARSNFASLDSTLQNVIQQNMKIDEGEYQQNPAVYTQILQEKKQFLRNQIRARQSRRILMIILNKGLLPMDIIKYNKIYEDYHLRVQYKMVLLMEEFASKRPKNDKMQGIILTMDQIASEIDVVQSELQIYLMETAVKMFDRETASLTKAFEMTNLKMQAFIHPVQQFASTLIQLDNRNHLDIVNKVGFIQRFLTRVKNRSLEIETLTSGVGLVISEKDLNECVYECCRDLVKSGEIEMRTRCEHLSLMLAHASQLNYVKDRQLYNAEQKLVIARDELKKIVSSRVFSKNNALIYELDCTSRQLRLIKDNIFVMEQNLTKKIQKCYDRELDETRAQLSDLKIRFTGYQEAVNAQIRAKVREEVNSIDGVMKATAKRFQDLDIQTKGESKPLPPPDKSPQMGLMDQLKKERLLKREHKENENEALQEVLKLQDVIRKQRLLYKMKEVIAKEKHQKQVTELRHQLTSNMTLWEQLAESKSREKVIRGEIDIAQREIATRDKIIERLKDNLKKEHLETIKLMQYKSTKSKRLDELESKAREFEVLSSVSLSKILGLLESKEKAINELKATEHNLSGQLQASVKVTNAEIQMMKQKINDESRLKLEAISKLQSFKNGFGETKSVMARTSSQGNDKRSESLSGYKTKMSFTTSTQKILYPDINTKMLEGVRQQVIASRSGASGLRSLVIAGQNQTTSSFGKTGQNIMESDSLCSTANKSIPTKKKNVFSTLSKHSLMK